MALNVRHIASTWTERLAIVGLFLFSIFLAQITAWKESEVFWLDVGGYPVWVRDLVRTLYYPYALFVLTLALVICRSVCGRLFRELRVRRIWGLLLVALVIIAGSFALLIANNVSNLLEGNELHYHEPGN